MGIWQALPQYWPGVGHILPVSSACSGRSLTTTAWGWRHERGGLLAAGQAAGSPRDRSGRGCQCRTRGRELHPRAEGAGPTRSPPTRDGPKSWASTRCGHGTTCSSAAATRSRSRVAYDADLAPPGRPSELTLGTGILVLPLRAPRCSPRRPRRSTAISGGRLTLGMAVGWYEREFDSCRRALPAPRADLRSEPRASPPVLDRRARHRRVPRLRFRSIDAAPARAAAAAADRRLRRRGAAARGDARDGWLTYFYTPTRSAGPGGRSANTPRRPAATPPRSTTSRSFRCASLDSFEAADRKARQYIGEYFDIAEWSDCTPDSAIRGTPRAVRRAACGAHAAVRAPRRPGALPLRPGAGRGTCQRRPAADRPPGRADRAVTSPRRRPRRTRSPITGRS